MGNLAKKKKYFQARTYHYNGIEFDFDLFSSRSLFLSLIHSVKKEREFSIQTFVFHTEKWIDNFWNVTEEKKVVSHVAAHTSHIYNMHVCCYVLIAIYHFDAFYWHSFQIQIYASECMEKRSAKIFHFSIPNAFSSHAFAVTKMQSTGLHCTHLLACELDFFMGCSWNF